MTVATQVSVPKVVTDNKDVNQLQQNSITAINKLQQQINTINGTVNGIANTPAPVTPTVTYPTSNYYSGYTALGCSWTTNAGTFVDGTNSGGNVLTQRKASGITVSAAASNLAGITFTPASATAVYQITASTNMYASNGGGQTAIQLTDGTVVIGNRGLQNNSNGPMYMPATMTGIYFPGVTNAITVKIQIVNPAGPSSSFGGFTSFDASIEWTIVRLV